MRCSEPDDIRRDSAHVERAEKMPPAASEELSYHNMSLPFIDGSIIAALFASVYGIAMIGIFSIMIGVLWWTDGVLKAAE